MESVQGVVSIVGERIGQSFESDLFTMLYDLLGNHDNAMDEGKVSVYIGT